jgi:anti-sigma regulatory factor (Ser/Thr protein kinase)
MVKYNSSGAGPITLTLQRAGHEVVVAVEDPDSEPFDLDTAPQRDITLPAELREPGGLGLQLVRRYVDGLQSSHVAGRTRITFRRRLEA